MKIKIKAKAPSPKTKTVVKATSTPSKTHTSKWNAKTIVDAVSQENRETYLRRAITEFVPWFKDKANEEIPDIRVSCGFPGIAGAGARGSRRVLGACWAAEASKDNIASIFISPLIDSTTEVLHVLAHEIVHAVVGHDAAHGEPFKRVARAIGLLGKLTSTYPGAQLTDFINEIIAKIGEYPHARLSLEEISKTVKRQTTRMIKCTCDKSGYTVRTTRQWLKKYGPPLSPVTKLEMVPEIDLAGLEDDDEDTKTKESKDSEDAA